MPDSRRRGPADFEVARRADRSGSRAARCVEVSELGAASAVGARAEPARPLDVRRFDRGVDTEWRRTSYSGLIRAEEQAASPGVDSEPEVEGTVDEDGEADEVDDELGRRRVDDRRGATTCRRRWTTCRPGRPSARWSTACSSTPTRRPPDLAAELAARVEEQRRWWSVEATTDELAAGAAADAAHLARAAGRRPHARRDRAGATGCASSTSRSRWPAATGPRPTYPSPRWPTSCVGTCPPTTRCGPTPTGWSRPSLGGQALRGYLSGSIDVVLRVGAPERPALPRRRLQDQPAGRARASR